MKRMTMIKIAALVLALAVTGCNKLGGAADAADMSMGQASAKVTVIEYASLACPVCAQWNNENFAGFKTKYVDSGRVRYVLREALTHDPAIAAAGFMVARCAGNDKYFKVVDAVYHAHDTIEASSSPRDELLEIAKANGLSEEQFQTCVADAKTLAGIRERWEGYMAKENIDGTPTFVVNGKKLVGNVAREDLDAAIVAAEKAPAP
jgi:protein-disulfide isomerase